MNEQEMIRFLRSELYQAMERDPELRSALKHIDAGKGTFQDTAQYSERTSELLGKILSRHVDELPEGMRETVCSSLLRERYEEVNGICAEVQEQLDAQNGIRLQPQKAPYPAERVQQVAHALEDPTVLLSVIQRRAKAPVANVSKSFHDDYMKKNADVRSRLGFKCYINRVAAAGCCKWCTEIAGHYVYGDEPEEVFHRHDNCSCTTTFENGRERQDVWSKRKWQADPAEVEANGFKPTVLSQDAAESLQNAAAWRLTFSTERGILNVGTDGMFRRKDDSKIEPMPKKQFRQILKAFKAQGGLIQFDDATDAYLESRNAEAITYDAKTILIRQKPGRASVFEKLIHTAQYRNGRNDGSYPSRLQCEIEAQEKLLKYSKAYKLTEPEIEQTRKALKAYRKELDAYYKNGGES